MTRALLIVALLAGLVQAQAIRVEGRVTTISGEATSAMVRLEGVANSTASGGRTPRYSQNTDADGKFAFEDVAPGRYTLTSYKPGFAPHPYGARSDSSPAAELVLDRGIELKGLSLAMTPLGVVSGRVTDQDGNPVAGVSVEVYRSGLSGRTGGLGHSDAQGIYRVSNLPSGAYYVKATPRGIRKPQAASVVTFYPDAVNLELGGEARGIDIRLRQVPAYSIRGKVMDRSTGLPASGARVAALSTESGLAALIDAVDATTGADGSFELAGVLPGSYMLLGSAAENWTGSDPGALPFLSQLGPGTGRGRLKLTVSGSDVNGVLLGLNAGAIVTGKITVEDGDLRDWLQPQSAGALNRRDIFLMSNEGRLASSAYAAFNVDGTFQLADVFASKYFVTVGNLADRAYVKSMRLNGQDVTRSMLDLTSGTGGSLEIVLSPKAAELDGTVRNDKGEPMRDVPVTVWPKIPDLSTRTGGIKTAKTDWNGGFRISSLAPGEYFVAAWEYPEVGLAENPAFLERFNGPDLAVKLVESAHEQVDLKLIPRDRIVAEAGKIP